MCRFLRSSDYLAVAMPFGIQQAADGAIRRCIFGESLQPFSAIKPNKNQHSRGLRAEDGHRTLRFTSEHLLKWFWNDSETILCRARDRWRSWNCCSGGPATGGRKVLLISRYSNRQLWLPRIQRAAHALRLMFFESCSAGSCSTTDSYSSLRSTSLACNPSRRANVY